MLESESTKLEIAYRERTETPEERWDNVRFKVCDLMDYRINHGSPPGWYEKVCIDNKDTFANAFPLNDIYNVNRLPNGFIGEVFFMDACDKLGIKCVPTYGDVDTWGADFMIGEGKNTRFLDVTINTSADGLKRKNRAGTFPTLFIPWYLASNQSETYVYHYLATGEFNSKDFMNNIISYNYRNLHTLKRDVWSDHSNGDGYMDLHGIQYLEGLEGTLKILKNGVVSHQ